VLPAHGKLASDVIPQSVTYVLSHGIRIVQLRQWVPVWIHFPRYLFQILDDVLTLGVDQQAALSGACGK
jgi:hypothetical protein